MRDVSFLMAFCVVICLGFAMLALSQEKHWRRTISDRPLSDQRAHCLRVGGIGSLFVGLVMAVMHDGASFGSVLWATSMSVGAAAIVFTLAWRPSWFRIVLTPFIGGAPRHYDSNAVSRPREL
jgi:uncharacterized protein YjeT (DUF2065 family)